MNIYKKLNEWLASKGLGLRQITSLQDGDLVLITPIHGLPPGKPDNQKVFSLPLIHAKGLQTYLGKELPHTKTEERPLEPGVALRLRFESPKNHVILTLYSTQKLMVQGAASSALFQTLCRAVQRFIDKLDAPF